MKRIINPNRTIHLIEQLVALWKVSVTASHHFLTGNDIERLIPFVEMGISSINNLIIMSDKETPIAFIGVEDEKVEMLFVSPDYFGKGVGSDLMKYVLDNYDVKYVDVNEQNPSAIGFYKHLSFMVFERTEVDDQGNPFPILKMKL